MNLTELALKVRTSDQRGLQLLDHCNLSAVSLTLVVRRESTPMPRKGERPL